MDLSTRGQGFAFGAPAVATKDVTAQHLIVPVDTVRPRGIDVELRAQGEKKIRVRVLDCRTLRYLSR